MTPAIIIIFNTTYLHVYIFFFKIRVADPSKCSLDPSKCSLNPSKCSLDPSKCSLDPSKCSLDPSKCSLDPSKCSLDPEGLFCPLGHVGTCLWVINT